MSTFDGFSKELVQFFKDLKKNNTKEWFTEHKEDYEKYVKQPASGFVVAMGERLKPIAPKVNAIPKINKSLFRINRDTRFSHDKRPYKTNLGILFWEGEGKRMESSGFYFHLEEGRVMLGSGIHTFSKGLLEKYREAVVDKKKGQRLKKAIDRVSDKGYIIRGKHYKRIPRGYDASHENAEFLLYNGLTAMKESGIPKEFNSHAIVDYAYSHFKNMHPLHEWLRESVL